MKQNNPSGSFAAHLFADAPEGFGEEKIESLCSRAESYGPFQEVRYPDPDAAENADGMCSICAWAWRRRRQDTADPSAEDNPRGSSAGNGAPK